jgi:O-antigen/teichoic acid export membrane protein
MSLKNKALRGVKWSTASTIIVTLLQLAQLSVLARLLVSSDFGLMSIVMVVIGFTQAFLDMGISNAIIHKQTITHDQLSTLYWVNVITGGVFFLFIALISPFVASFYQQPELAALVILAGTTLLIQSFGQQYMVLFQKELRFTEIAIISITTKLVSFIVSVWYAYHGHGVYAMVYGAIAAAMTQTALFVAIGLKQHRPAFTFKWHTINEFLSFGYYQMGERSLNYINSQIDTILIGKLLGIETVGVYNVAKQLIMRPAQIINPIITKVSFPLMAKVQNQTGTLRRTYLKTINYLSSVNFPVYAGMIVLAPDIVLLLFGQKWMSAIPIVQILSLYGAVRSTGNPIGSLLLAKGRARLGFIWNLGLFFVTQFAIIIASHWGIVAISWILVGLMISLVVPNWYLLVRPLCDAKFYEYHRQILLPAVIAIIAGLAGYACSGLVSNRIGNVFMTSIVGGSACIALNALFNKEFVDEMKRLVLVKA